MQERKNSHDTTKIGRLSVAAGNEVGNADDVLLFGDQDDFTQ